MTATNTKELVTSDAIRAKFPALQSDLIYLENAGGSQVPAVVAERIREYMLHSYVRLGAGYDLSQYCTGVVADAHAFVNRIMNGEEVGQVVLGPSSTSLVMTLADAYARSLTSDAEIVVAESGHETNVGPWMRLADRGFTVRNWPMDPDALDPCPLDTLRPLLNEKTAIVAFPHVSNLLGGIVDPGPIVDAAHEVGARVVVDGVAFAPHRPIDVRKWGVDWYVYSTYKVYGPHMAAMFGRDDAFAEIEGPHHFFIPRESIPYKFEAAGVSHEGCAGLLALQEYLNFMAGVDPDDETSRDTIESAFNRMAELEFEPQTRLIDYLGSRDDCRIVGPETGALTRVGTISFTHASQSSKAVAESLNARNFALRHGHMYSYRLCRRLGIDPDDGVVRVSLVHYNTVDEIDRLISGLDEVLG
ncbi:MAG: aminotransferase class V-fold PLP-dependent enzyme [Phycisphaerales bacterium]